MIEDGRRHEVLLLTMRQGKANALDLDLCRPLREDLERGQCLLRQHRIQNVLDSRWRGATGEFVLVAGEDSTCLVDGLMPLTLPS